MGTLDGRIALVTGAGQAEGIGQGIVRAFLKAGAQGVAFTDIDTDAAKVALEAVSSAFGADRVMFLKQDVSSPEEWQQALASVLKRFGGLDILVNNAGASFPGSLATLSVEDLRRAFSVNFESQFLGMKTCMDALAERAPRWTGGAAIINNSSMGAYMADATNLPYNSTKAASRMMTMCAARELGPKKIRVNSVHYGVIETPLVRKSWERRVKLGQYPDAATARKSMMGASPLKTVGTPDDAAGVVCFLASDEARFITGSGYTCDGALGNHF